MSYGGGGYRASTVGMMLSASDVMFALESNRARTDPAHAEAIIRSYVETKLARGKTKLDTSQKLEILERQLPRFGREFYAVRGAYGLGQSRVLRPPPPVVTTTTARRASTTTNTTTHQRTASSASQSAQARAAAARLQQLAAAPPRPRDPEGPTDEPPPPPYSLEDSNPEATQVLAAQLSSNVPDDEEGAAAAIQRSTSNVSRTSVPPPRHSAEETRPPPPNGAERQSSADSNIDDAERQAREESELEEAMRISMRAEKERLEYEAAVQASLAQAEEDAMRRSVQDNMKDGPSTAGPSNHASSSSYAGPSSSSTAPPQLAPPPKADDLSDMFGSIDFNAPTLTPSPAPARRASVETPLGSPGQPPAAHSPLRPQITGMQSRNPFLTVEERELLQSIEEGTPGVLASDGAQPVTPPAIRPTPSPHNGNKPLPPPPPDVNEGEEYEQSDDHQHYASAQSSSHSDQPPALPPRDTQYAARNGPPPSLGPAYASPDGPPPGWQGGLPPATGARRPLPIPSISGAVDQSNYDRQNSLASSFGIERRTASGSYTGLDRHNTLPSNYNPGGAQGLERNNTIGSVSSQYTGGQGYSPAVSSGTPELHYAPTGSGALGFGNTAFPRVPSIPGTPGIPGVPDVPGVPSFGSHTPSPPPVPPHPNSLPVPVAFPVPQFGSSPGGSSMSSYSNPGPPPPLPARSPTGRSPAPEPAPIMVGGENALEMLRDYDTVFLVDDSTSMAGERWEQAKTAIMGVVAQAVQYDEDGLDVYFLNSKRVGKDLRTAEDVEDVFAGLNPHGATPTGLRMEAILRDYMARLERSTAHPEEGEVKSMNLIVVTDGAFAKPVLLRALAASPQLDRATLLESAPTDDPESVLITIAKRLDRGDYPLSQVGIQLLQIGDDAEATEALQELDDGLAAAHGVRDMVDTVPYNGEAMSANLIVKVLLGGINRRLDRWAVGPSGQVKDARVVQRVQPAARTVHAARSSTVQAMPARPSVGRSLSVVAGVGGWENPRGGVAPARPAAPMSGPARPAQQWSAPPAPAPQVTRAGTWQGRPSVTRSMSWQAGGASANMASAWSPAPAPTTFPVAYRAPLAQVDEHAAAAWASNASLVQSPAASTPPPLPWTVAPSPPRVLPTPPPEPWPSGGKWPPVALTPLARARSPPLPPLPLPTPWPAPG